MTHCLTTFSSLCTWHLSLLIGDFNECLYIDINVALPIFFFFKIFAITFLLLSLLRRNFSSSPFCVFYFFLILSCFLFVLLSFANHHTYLVRRERRLAVVWTALIKCMIVAASPLSQWCSASSTVGISSIKGTFPKDFLYGTEGNPRRSLWASAKYLHRHLDKAFVTLRCTWCSWLVISLYPFRMWIRPLFERCWIWWALDRSNAAVGKHLIRWLTSISHGSNLLF